MYRNRRKEITEVSEDRVRCVLISHNAHLVFYDVSKPNLRHLTPAPKVQMVD